MSHPRRKYDPEFKAGAVRIVRETRRPISEPESTDGFVGSTVWGCVGSGLVGVCGPARFGARWAGGGGCAFIVLPATRHVEDIDRRLRDFVKRWGDHFKHQAL